MLKTIFEKLSLVTLILFLFLIFFIKARSLPVITYVSETKQQGSILEEAAFTKESEK